MSGDWERGGAGLGAQRNLAAKSRNDRKSKALEGILWSSAHEVVPAAFLHRLGQWAKKYGCGYREMVGVALEKLPQHLGERVQLELEQLEAGRSTDRREVGGETYYPVKGPIRGDKWLHKAGEPGRDPDVHWAWAETEEALWTEGMRDELDEHLAPAGSAAHLHRRAQRQNLSMSFGVSRILDDLSESEEVISFPKGEGLTSQLYVPQDEQLYRAFLGFLTKLCNAEEQLEEIRQQLTAWDRGTDSLYQTVVKVQKLVDLGCLAQLCDEIATSGYLEVVAGPNSLEQTAVAAVKNSMTTAELGELESLNLSLKSMGRVNLRPKSWSQISEWARGLAEKQKAVARRAGVGDPVRNVAVLTMDRIHPQRKRNFSLLVEGGSQAAPKQQKQMEEKGLGLERDQIKELLGEAVASLGVELVDKGKGVEVARRLEEQGKTIAALQRQLQEGWGKQSEQLQEAVVFREQWRINQLHEKDRQLAALRQERTAQAGAKAGKGQRGRGRGGGGKSKNACWNFTKEGKCKFGEKCRFSHEPAKPPPAPQGAPGPPPAEVKRG